MKTIKELADELGVVDQTVRNEILKQEIQMSKVRNSKTKAVYVLEDVDAASVKAAIQGRRNSKTNSNNGENGTKPILKPNQIITLEMSKKIEDLEVRVEELTEQIKERDAALKEKDEQLRKMAESYTERLLNLEENNAKERAELTKQVSDLTAALKHQQELLENEQKLHAKNILAIEQHDERSWWQRLFGIKKKTEPNNQ